MAMKKEDALRIIDFHGNRQTQFVASILVNAPQFSKVAARRLKCVANLVTLGNNVDLSREFDPVVNGLKLGWEGFDLVAGALYRENITNAQFQALVQQYGTPYVDSKGVPQGLGALLESAESE